jgi:hypothetical protein
MKNDFNPTGLSVLCILAVMYLPAQSVLAASSRVRMPPKHLHATWQQTARQQNTETAFTTQNFVQNSLYKHLMENEHFLKWQDMAKYFWEQQTGEQRLMNTSQKRFYKDVPRPIGKITPPKSNP